MINPRQSLYHSRRRTPEGTLRDPRYGPATLERVKEFVSYDPDLGVFIRLKATQGKYVGQIAGFLHSSKKYRVLSVAGVVYEEHTLAYMMGTGLLPQGEVVHLDGDPFNNRLYNLKDWVSGDDPARGVFEDPATGMWHVLLYTRGGNGRKSFGLFKTREEAATVSDLASQMLGQGTDARRVRTLLSLRDKSPDIERSRGPVYVPITYQGELVWAVSKLKWDRRLPKIGMPTYGPFADKESAKEAVEKYSSLRDLGGNKVASLKEAGFGLLVNQGGVWESLPIEGYVRGENAEKLRDLPVTLQTQIGRDGVTRWLIPYLPFSPAAAQQKFYVATSGDLTASLSEGDTWKAVKEYQILRKQNWEHFAAMRRVGLAEWDYLSQCVKHVLKMRTGKDDTYKPVRILQDDDGLWYVTGLRKLSWAVGKEWPDHGYFKTREEAETALDVYTRISPVDKESNLGGHDYALTVSGLHKAVRP